MNRQTATSIPPPAPTNQLQAAIEVDGVVRIAMTWSPTPHQRWHCTLTGPPDEGKPQKKKPVGIQAHPLGAVVEAREILNTPTTTTA